jgi:hypothetical protein
MRLKYPKNMFLGISVAALLVGMVFLGGYANIKPANTQPPIKACQASGSCCPASAPMASYQAATDAQMASTDDSGTLCPKPCCAGDAAEGCDNPCPIPCPKPCCRTADSTGCPMSAAENNVK